jgi:hypothetical protein
MLDSPFGSLFFLKSARSEYPDVSDGMLCWIIERGLKTSIMSACVAVESGEGALEGENDQAFIDSDHSAVEGQ